MPYATPLTAAVFCAVYLGMALGRWPGLKVDRTGIAILGAIVLYASGIVSGPAALAAPAAILALTVLVGGVLSSSVWSGGDAWPSFPGAMRRGLAGDRPLRRR